MAGGAEAGSGSAASRPASRGPCGSPKSHLLLSSGVSPLVSMVKATDAGKKKRLGEVRMIRREEYAEVAMESKVEMIRALVPLGLMHVQELLDEEVRALAGERYRRKETASVGRRGVDGTGRGRTAASGGHPMTTLDLATVDHLLTTTRSVRKRLDLTRPVEPEMLERCIEIALQAPTGSNAQGWHFVVAMVRSSDTRKGHGHSIGQTR